MHITPALMEAAYELLRITPPFRKWKLAEPDDVVFRIIKTELTRGTFYRAGKRGSKLPTIEISMKCIGSVHSLITTMAHEMTHMHEDTNHVARDDVMHSARFKRLAAQVCRHHGFDAKLF